MCLSGETIKQTPQSANKWGTWVKSTHELLLRPHTSIKFEITAKSELHNYAEAGTK